MNSPSLRVMRGRLLREAITLLLFAGLMLQSAAAVVPLAPDWWTTQGVLTTGATADDYAVANIGQLKNLASKAALELDENLPNGAGDDIHTLLDAWSADPADGVTRDDYAALTLGQLKSVGRLFYDRLIAEFVRPSGSYPWTSTNADDYALANVGQLKNVFAFDTAFADTNNNGIPDRWETQMFGNLNQNAIDDPDQDGLGNAAEFLAGTDPTKADTDGDGFSDGLEQQWGSSPTQSASTPVNSNPSFLDAIKSYDVGWLECNDNWTVNAPSSGGTNWSYNHGWNVLADKGFVSNTASTQPSVTLKSWPLSDAIAPAADTYWQTVQVQSATDLPYDQDFNPLIGYVLDYNWASSGTTYTGRQFRWQRYRIRLDVPLPFDLDETYLRVETRYAQTGSNPQSYSAPTTTVVPVTLHIAKGQTTGDWAFSIPTADKEQVYYSLVQVPITIRSNPNKLVPPAAEAMYTPASENEAHDKLVLANGLDSNGQKIDQLGALPIGLGRLDDAASNNSYVAPMETFAVVPDIAGLTWKWKRTVNFRCWKIHLGRETPTSPHNWLVSLQLHQEDPDDDPLPVHQDVTRSAATGRIYTGDNSGVNLRLEALGLAPNDYLYEERQFTYSLECTFNSQPAFVASSLGIGQVMKMKHNANTYPVQNGNFYLNFDPVENSNAVRVLDLKISADEVRAIVGGIVPINIPPSVNY